MHEDTQVFMNYLFNIEAIEKARWKSPSVLYKKHVGISLALERVIGSAVN